jgi:2-C-methyl-D-erythritol 4-phosphate cytidylyltransferase
MSRVGLLIAAAGRGERLGCAEPKALVRLGGKTLLEHVLARLAPLADETVIAITPGEMDQFRRFLATGRNANAELVEGGSRRQDSIRTTLACFSSSDVVIIHDAARPLCPPDVAQRCLDVVDAGVGACAALPLTDTLVREEEPGYYGENIERAGVWQVQTPQVFVWQEIAEAHAWAYEQGREFTDDASLYCARRGKVRLMQGSPLSAKVTTPADLAWLGHFV